MKQEMLRSQKEMKIRQDRLAEEIQSSQKEMKEINENMVDNQTEMEKSGNTYTKYWLRWRTNEERSWNIGRGIFEDKFLTIGNRSGYILEKVDRWISGEANECRNF